MNLSHRDKKIIWHPFTQEKTASLPLAIKHAKGSYVYDENNKAYLDLISSWWVNLHGHAHPDIAYAIYQQALNLEHVIFAGFTHEPAVTLCENLKALLPLELSRFFFSDNGSTAVEAALKMAYQYWWNQKIPEKTIFLSFEGGYHGDTFGAMSVSSASGFHDAFSKLLFSVEIIPFPATWQGDDAIEAKEAEALYLLEKSLDTFSNKIAALIVEPLVQGASGMRMCRPQFIKKAVQLVRKYKILVIFDEVMTGFGRTGTLFAFEQTQVIPDFLCLSKGLSGGFLPLALTITTDKIYEAFLGETFSQAFAHGHSYTANPLGCAAALASLKLLLQDDTQNAIQTLHDAHQAGIATLMQSGAPIQHPRIQGTLAAFDLHPSYTPQELQALRIKFLEKGLLIRPLGQTIYLLPPYCTSQQEIRETYGKIKEIICKVGYIMG